MSKLLLTWMMMGAMAAFGQSRDSLPFKGTHWIGIGTTGHPANIHLLDKEQGYECNIRYKHYIKEKLAIGLLCGYSNWVGVSDPFGKYVMGPYNNSSYGLSSSIHEADVSVQAFNILVNSTFRLQSGKRYFREIGAFYSFAASEQQLIIISSTYSGGDTLTYSNSYNYHTIGICGNQYLRVWKGLHLVLGATLFWSINRPEIFNEVIRNYYTASTFIPGSGFNRIPIGVTIGLEYRIPAASKTN